MCAPQAGGCILQGLRLVTASALPDQLQSNVLKLKLGSALIELRPYQFGSIDSGWAK